MRVLVTGGNGRLGRWVNRELAAHGHQVVSIDRQLPGEGQGSAGGAVQYRVAELGDVGQVIGALAGCQAVIHLGAIPVPWQQPDEVVFGNNTGATFAVLHAATLLGMRTAVIASSVAALGMFWAPRPFFPHYAPVDEAHPLLPHDPYGTHEQLLSPESIDGGTMSRNHFSRPARRATCRSTSAMASLVNATPVW